VQFGGYCESPLLGRVYRSWLWTCRAMNFKHQRPKGKSGILWSDRRPSIRGRRSYPLRWRPHEFRLHNLLHGHLWDESLSLSLSLLSTCLSGERPYCNPHPSFDRRDLKAWPRKKSQQSKGIVVLGCCLVGPRSFSQDGTEPQYCFDVAARNHAWRR
jgi:hypothetical protein